MTVSSTLAVVSCLRHWVPRITAQPRDIMRRLSRLQIADVPDGEDSHDYGHQESIHNVDEDFVRYQIAIVTLEILHDSEDGPDQDQRARYVEDVEMSLPGDGSLSLTGMRSLDHPGVEQECCDHEEAKNCNLDEETGDDDLLSHVVHFESSCRLNTTTTCLESESDHVACDKDLCNPFDRDERKVFSSKCTDKTG